MIYLREVLTWVLDGGDGEFEAVALGSPSVRHVLQCDVVGPREHRAHRVLRVAARQVSLHTNTSRFSHVFR